MVTHKNIHLMRVLMLCLSCLSVLEIKGIMLLATTTYMNPLHLFGRYTRLKNIK